MKLQRKKTQSALKKGGSRVMKKKGSKGVAGGYCGKKWYPEAPHKGNRSK